jgi:hypothetical protein
LSAEEQVVAIFTEEAVVSLSADREVVPARGADYIIASASKDDVAAAAGHDNIAAACPEYQVAPVGADSRRGQTVAGLGLGWKFDTRGRRARASGCLRRSGED